jgi:hypothetical protein
VLLSFKMNLDPDKWIFKEGLRSQGINCGATYLQPHPSDHLTIGCFSLGETLFVDQDELSEFPPRRRDDPRNAHLWM